MHYFAILLTLMLSSCANNKITKNILDIKKLDDQQAQKFGNLCEEKSDVNCFDEIKAIYQSGNEKKAYDLAKLRCEKNEKMGCASLGSLYNYDGDVKKAEELWLKDCKASKDGQSCSLLATIYTLKKDFKESLKYAARGCNKENLLGCERLLYKYLVQKKYEELKKFSKKMKKVCDKTNKLEFCYMSLASVLRDDSGKKKKALLRLCKDGVESDYCDFVDFYDETDQSKIVSKSGYKSICLDKKNGYACNIFANYQKELGNEIAFLKYIEKACEFASSTGCYELGYINSQKNNWVSSSYYFKRACSNQYMQGCYSAGIAFRQIDKKELSSQFYDKSCHLNYPQGCLRLSEVLAEKGNNKEAEEYAKKACDQGNGHGCYSVGVKKHKEKSLKEASNFFERGCSMDNPQSCLGKCLVYSEKKDFKLAKKNLKKACDLMSEDSLTCSDLEKINKKQKLVSKDFEPSCSYDPSKPWWYWGLIGLGVALGAGAAN